MIKANLEKVSALIVQLLARVPRDELADAVVFGSSAITLNGRDLERQIDDLDLFVSEAAYERLRTRATEVVKKPGVTALDVGIQNIEILKTFPGVEYGPVSHRASPTVASHGLRVAALEDLVTWKRAQGRPKDLEDLKKIAQSHG